MTNVDRDFQRTSEELMRFASELLLSSWPQRAVIALWVVAALITLLSVVLLVRPFLIS